MLLGGDEMRRTQKGNNNAYCQDNEISWIDWTLAEKNKDLVDFTARLIALRKAHPVFRRKTFFKDITDKNLAPEIAWYDINAKVPDWNKTNRFLAFKLFGSSGTDSAAGDNDFYIASNMDIYDLTISLPSLPEGKKWYLVEDTSIETSTYTSIDTGLDEGFAENPAEIKYEKLYAQKRYVLLANSTIILMSK